jgi:hypothetical protein
MRDMQELLQRYYDGDTTLEEEAWLKQYLAKHPETADPASALLMADLHTAAGVRKLPPGKRILRAPALWATTAVAASIVAFFCLRNDVPAQEITLSPLKARLLVSPEVKGEIKDEELALEQARKALNYVSTQLNKGIQSMEHLEKVETSLDKVQNETL